jgi:hypothetical protein
VRDQTSEPIIVLPTLLPADTATDRVYATFATAAIYDGPCIWCFSREFDCLTADPKIQPSAKQALDLGVDRVFGQCQLDLVGSMP